MEFSLESWLDRYIPAVQNAFGARIRLIGIQGSCRRGEATDSSDIDAVLILDTLSADDLARYRALVGTLPDAERVCGFVSGENELRCWSRADLFQFYFDTRPLVGSLDAIVSRPTEDEAREAVKAGACALYHAACHSVVFEDRVQNLPFLLKSVLFIQQARVFLHTGQYPGTTAETLAALSGEDRALLAFSREKRAYTQEEADACYRRLLAFASRLITEE